VLKPNGIQNQDGRRVVSASLSVQINVFGSILDLILRNQFGKLPHKNMQMY
jgi:hypothetical protein